VPEGDTIHAAARRVGAALVGREIVSIETPQPRHARDRWPERLAGRAIERVDARGKHLLVHFEGDLVLHSHLRMTGMWGVYEHGRRWRRSPRRAWLVIRTPEHEVVQFDGPVLELMTAGRARIDRRIAGLGPDVLADDFDGRTFIARLREDDQSRGIGEALLDQRNLCGIGNIWKSEACFAAGVDPWRRVSAVTDAEALSIVEAVRPLMRVSVGRGGHPTTSVYDRRGRPCPRCGGAVRARGQGEDNRTTYWCPACQP
jgi:endonuclease VIII